MGRAAHIEALYRREADHLHHVVARRVAADHAVIDDACAFAWAQLVASVAVDPDGPHAFAWLATVAIREGWRLARVERRAEVRLDDGLVREAASAVSLTTSSRPARRCACAGDDDTRLAARFRVPLEQIARKRDDLRPHGRR